MSDQAIVDAAAKRHAQGLVINHLDARVIAAAWHGGQASPLCALATSGAIVEGIEDELSECGDAPELAALAAYVEQWGQRGPQALWSHLHW